MAKIGPDFWLLCEETRKYADFQDFLTKIFKSYSGLFSSQPPTMAIFSVPRVDQTRTSTDGIEQYR